MSIKVLSVGQCNIDGPRVRKLLETAVGVGVDTADTLDSATEKLKAGGYGLVLINRQLAFEGTYGLDLIKRMKSAENPTPVMVVSDKPEVQQEAMAAGAVQGFGKKKLNDPETVTLLKAAAGV